MFYALYAYTRGFSQVRFSFMIFDCNNFVAQRAFELKEGRPDSPTQRNAYMASLGTPDYDWDNNPSQKAHYRNTKYTRPWVPLVWGKFVFRTLELTDTPTNLANQVKVGHALDQSRSVQLRGPERAHQNNEPSNDRQGQIADFRGSFETINWLYQGLKLTLIPRSDFSLLLSKSWSKSDRHRSYFLNLKADIWLDWVAKICS